MSTHHCKHEVTKFNTYKNVFLQYSMPTIDANIK